jgi:hypothetical protein
MTLDFSFAWITLLVLGAVHGINPAMGWLFAVSLGLQEGSGRAVWRALGPLALGHALAIGATLLAAAALGIVFPLAWLKWIAAAALLGFGLLHLTRHRHPRYGGMRVGPKDLTVWSFLMASAHGAGLMALPFVLGLAAVGHGALATGAHVHAPAAAHADGLAMAAVTGADALLAVLVHTAGYLAVAGVLAVVVYEKLGLRLLRSAWINLNVIWAAALIMTALLTPLL